MLPASSMGVIRKLMRIHSAGTEKAKINLQLYAQQLPDYSRRSCTFYIKPEISCII